MAALIELDRLTGYFGQPRSVVERVQRAGESSLLVLRLGRAVYT
jgi:hypothetical protein